MSNKKLDTITKIGLTITYGDGSSSAYTVDPSGYSYHGGGRPVSSGAVRRRSALIKTIADFLEAHNGSYGIPAKD